ncbi:MAG: GNAT family N-acetyltransferase [Bacillota bacterium]
MAKRRAEDNGRYQFEPATTARWDDLVALFGERGACNGCWCMWWRLKGRDFEAGVGAGNRQALRDLMDQGVVPGILAYEGDRPVGWCSVGPRQDFPRLNRSQRLRPIDDRPVWSIVCYFVDGNARGRGLMQALTEAAVDYARSNGARIVEAYPTEPEAERSNGNLYMGVAHILMQAGFAEVAHRGGPHRILRRYL